MFSQHFVQFSNLISIGAELQQKEPNWTEIYNSLGFVNSQLKSLPWGHVTPLEINFLTRPCLHILLQYYSKKEGIPHRFAKSIVERALIFLHEALEASIHFLQPEQRHECFLGVLNLLKYLILHKVEGVSDEILIHSVQLLILIMNKDTPEGLMQFGINMVIGLVFILTEILDQAARPVEVRVAGLVLLEGCFQRFGSPGLFQKSVPGVLSLVMRLVSRNPSTDSSKVLSQALSLVKVVLLQTPTNIANGTQESWAKDFKRGTCATLNKLDVLLDHPSPRVQRSLLEVYFWALEDRANLYDQEFKTSLLDSVLPLCMGCHSQVQNFAFQTLAKAADPTGLIECFRIHCGKLVQVFTSGVEAEKLCSMKLLSSIVLLLGPAIDRHLPNLAECWMAWCKCLLPEDATEIVEISESRITIKGASSTFNDPIALCTEIQNQSKSFNLKYMRDPKTMDAFMQFFQLLGLYFRHLDTLLFEATQILTSQALRPYHSAAMFLMDCILSGRDLLPKDLPLLAFHKENHSIWDQPRETADIRLSLLPTIIDAMDRFRQLKNIDSINTDPIDFQAIHMVAVTATNHGPNFRLELFSTLYTIIEKVGHANTLVSWAAKHCLKVIEISCGYSSMIDLIRDNFDYLIHSVTLRLHPTNIHPPTASMLSALFRLSQGEDLALLDDIFDLVADGLHASSAASEKHTVSLFLEVFSNMVLPITKCLYNREKQILTDPAYRLEYQKVSSGLQGFISEYKSIQNDKMPDFIGEVPPQEDEAELTHHRIADDAVLKRCHGRLEKILSTASCFICHSDSRCRKLSMQVIESVASTSGDLFLDPELAFEVRQPLDPMWHRTWPGLKAQLDSTNPILCEAALSAIASIQAFSPDFLGPLVANQAIPKVLSIIKGSSAPHPLRLSGLKFLVSAIRHSTPKNLDPWELFDTIEDLLPLHQAGLPEVLDLVTEELIPSLVRNGGAHADIAYMLTSTLPRIPGYKPKASITASIQLDF